MNAAFALIPVILLRYAVLGMLDKAALSRAANFPMPGGKGVLATLFYMITNLLLFVYPFFLKINADNPAFYFGLAVYVFGAAVYAVSMFDYAHPGEDGMNIRGLYGLSRNPMYVGYFFYFLGCVLLTHSLVLLVILIIFQISSHWIILAEEQWCIGKFGESYISYMKKVRRYF